MFWQAPGVWVTAVGYAGGSTPNPTYEEVCSGRTGHTEAVLVVYDPKATSYDALLKLFWESHDPTQGMRQGNDVGTQYRSAIYTYSPEQRRAAEASRQTYQPHLENAGYGAISTEIADAPPFYFAEDYHQQYLAKNPHGYCGLGGTGVSLPDPGQGRRRISGVPRRGSACRRYPRQNGKARFSRRRRRRNLRSPMASARSCCARSSAAASITGSAGSTWRLSSMTRP